MINRFSLQVDNSYHKTDILDASLFCYRWKIIKLQKSTSFPHPWERSFFIIILNSSLEICINARLPHHRCWNRILSAGLYRSPPRCSRLVSASTRELRSCRFCRSRDNQKQCLGFTPRPRSKSLWLRWRTLREGGCTWIINEARMIRVDLLEDCLGY